MDFGEGTKTMRNVIQCRKLNQLTQYLIFRCKL